MGPGRKKLSEAAVGQGPVSPSMDTHNNILELFCRFWNAQVWEKSWYAAHKDVDSRPVKPEGWWYWLPGGSEVKVSACNTGDLGSIPGWEDPLEKEMATHSSIPAWRIPWMEEPGGL